jgi:putative hydrolase
MSERSVEHRDPVEDLRRIAFLLERTLESSYRVKAFRTAAAALEALPPDDVLLLARTGGLRGIKGIGERTANVVEESVAGREPEYLAALEASAAGPLADGGEVLRGALRGDLHLHSDWSDGGSPIEEMARTAAELGHEYAALTDHSPRLTVARGLTPQRLRRQLDVVAAVDAGLAPFRLLTGIEVDILADGGLDQEPQLLAELDVVVSSVHSDLRMPADAMTRRMITAIENPHTDVLGHCTGRYVTDRSFLRGRFSGQTRSGKGRPESQFDAERVFAACADAGVALEINSRPERLDPPLRLLRQAVEAGCLFAIDTDAHAPGQLDWQPLGGARAEQAGVPAARVVNTWPLEDLLAWTRDHGHRPRFASARDEA